MFLVAVSPDESGEDALDWLMSELVEDGDEVIAMRVKDMGESERHTEVAHEHLREEANEMLQTVLQKNNEEDGRKVSDPSAKRSGARRSGVKRRTGDATSRRPEKRSFRPPRVLSELSYYDTS